MAGASDPLEDMLFSEVDEKAVSDLVGSLESQLAGQSDPAAKADENGRAGSVAHDNHHLGKTLPGTGGTTTQEHQQQQHGRCNKPVMRQGNTSKSASPDKSTSSPASSGEPSSSSPAASVHATSISLQSHGASITTLTTTPGMSTLTSTVSISTVANRSQKVASSPCETSTGVVSPRRRFTTPRRSAAARVKSLNGAVTTRRSSSSSSSSTATGEISASPGSPRPAPPTVNTATFTLSSGQSAIALDRGTPTIALRRLPNHIVASIAQNGTSVSALVERGAHIGPLNATAAPHSTNEVRDTCTEGSLSKSELSSQMASVNSDNMSSTPDTTTPPTTTTLAATTTVTTTSVSQPLTSATVAPTNVSVVTTTSICVTGLTTPVTTTMVRPAALSPTPVMVTSAQPRPGLTTPQRIVTPQLIVRPPQQQTTIQLPPGFTIPPGMVLVRTELGQLVMVPQQALAQAQAQAQAQNNTSPRPATPSTGTAFRVTTAQSPVTPQTNRQCALTPAKMTPSPCPPPSSPALQTPSSSSSSCPALRPKGPVAVAVTTSPQTPVVMAPQASSQASQPVQPAQTTIAATAGSPLLSQEMQENVKKCKNFLATLIKLASHNSPSPETSKNVKSLVQDLLDAKIEPEEFTSRLQTELKSSPQPYLVPFLKKSLPALRLSLMNNQHSLIQPPQQGVKPVPGSVAPAIMTGPAVRARHPNSVTTSTFPAGHATAVGIKAAGAVGGQVRMPVVITQSIRAQGTMGKGTAILAGKSPMGLAVQISGNQKNKLNDTGGGSFRDDDDINDVASMAGVNLNEESARILATNSELVGTQIRSCKDEAFLHPGLLHRRILETAKKYGVTEVPMEAVTFISHATQSRLRTMVEKVSVIAQHRLDSCKDDESYTQTADARSQLRFFEQLERMEKQRKDEQEREILLKAAKSRSRQEDPEQARLKQKAKEMQQQELAQIRQREANLTALAAIGPRKKRKVDSPGSTPSGTEAQFEG
ncbi:transcription initiation factor TFIID subunit 4-like isoform X3 [Eucyclogobius newberryi]|uniref:transcription initiation factor TFIID subunit 4-like isoform X3 n=1 Tax=Eucyclogobius newberryi TaxID=166745 RepID=UPI003B5C2E76